MQKSCLVCGNIFFKKSAESKRYWESKKYCSITCSLTKTTVRLQPNLAKAIIFTEARLAKLSRSLKGRAGNKGSFKKGFTPWIKGRKMPEYSGELHPNWKDRINVTCAHCAKEIALVPWQMRKRKRFFCNRACWALGTRGKGSPVFKGDASRKRLRNRIMELPEYKYWRIGILMRDNHRCVVCASIEKLEVDHIKSFALIAKENVIKTTEQARNCKELWDQENGRTLCKECHRKTDNYFKKIIH